ncbi:glycosyl hydrolase family 5 [Tenacibaculum sp. Bg11-29]|uniref:glycoside hydrolase family 2 TIM barrel-domain containing protein n=1 Tax=Tenacibaculum sp. Bg11-29 TaxID=2058306 RepID=UPI000C3479FE|nr:glycoside hydrolase family 2 TIM barrel-domain containing protein [Tenacibaculum sp. Bg11-29]PKH51547.1 glycosyl hydrolase family 5 [Tenacibaculum sp. Bg11-29]
MVGLNRNIIRVILITSYIMITAFIIAGVSALFSYLNTGADRSMMLHTEIKKEVQYTPKITWAPLQNEGREMDMENLKNLERDYLNAWYVKHIAYKTNTTIGIEDYYTDHARENIYKIIKNNKEQKTVIDATTLQHQLTLDFFSEDGQLIVVTDTDVIEYKRVLKNKQLILDTSEKSTYKIIFLLEDGFWRIRHLVKENSENHILKNKATPTDSLHIKGINYYPKNTPWNMFGNTFNKETINNDFKIIKEAGLNSVRIFIQYEDFGKATVKNDKLTKLIQTLDLAKANNLKVVLTLFDFYGNYFVLDWTLNQQHATTIIKAVKDHDALLAWDIKNEPNLDFKTRGKEIVIAWLNNMINLVKSIDTKHPVTIGWSNTKSAVILKEKVDFISFHYYESLENLSTSIQELRNKIPNKPLVMQEFGISSYNGFWKPFGSSKKDQANYHKKAQELIELNNLQFMSWTLYDFEKIPKSVVGSLPWRKNPQRKFGFITKSGKKKAAFKYISGSK